MKIKFVNLVFCLTISGFLSAQTITNVQSKREGNTIAVNYNLQYEDAGTISLFVSEDGGKNFTGPLKSVSGDVGSNIRLGSNKKIVWDVTKDKEILYGKNIVFRVKAISKFGIFTDSRDGKICKTVNIGNQTWMAENLNYSTSSGSWCYDDNKSNCDKYGRLYDRQTAKNVCPSGWRLPSKTDFETLLINVGGSGSNAYNALLETGNSGFSALRGGWRYNDGNFDGIRSNGYWWSSSENDNYNTWSLYMSSLNQKAEMSDYEESGFSVRCIKD
jgi:uncharacterized protein (TIGR02145 family)